MTVIVFVCRGNTCRSPLAMAYARSVAERRVWADQHRFLSAGVAVQIEAMPADPRAATVAQRIGLDLHDHATRALTPAQTAEASALIALDRSIRDEIVRRHPDAASRVHLLMDFAPHLGLHDVADPYTGTDADYARAFVLIGAGVDGLFEWLQRTVQSRFGA